MHDFELTTWNLLKFVELVLECSMQVLLLYRDLRYVPEYSPRPSHQAGFEILGVSASIGLDVSASASASASSSDCIF